MPYKVQFGNNDEWKISPILGTNNEIDGEKADEISAKSGIPCHNIGGQTSDLIHGYKSHSPQHVKNFIVSAHSFNRNYADFVSDYDISVTKGAFDSAPFILPFSFDSPKIRPDNVKLPVCYPKDKVSLILNQTEPE